MKIALKNISGPWDAGWILDKHTLSSQYLGDGPTGRPIFDTKRSEVGEALYRLKYNGDMSQAAPLAHALATHIYPKLHNVGLIVPMPGTQTRNVQPVSAVAQELGSIVKVGVFTNLLRKTPGSPSLKNLASKDQKIAAIGDSLSINDEIEGDGAWNVLLVDDLYATGASMEMACAMLRTYSKIKKIYVAALTWK